VLLLLLLLLCCAVPQVPILKVPSEDIVMPDSDAIVAYLEETYPTPAMKSEGGIPEWCGNAACRQRVPGAELARR
jgi:glutathione S-transferase